MDKSFLQKLYQSHQACPTCPAPADVSHFFVELLGALFADFTQLAHLTEAEFTGLMHKLQRDLEKLLRNNGGATGNNAAKLSTDFFEALPSIYAMIEEDVTAMYEGDPAAKSRSEVVRTYPGFYAIAAYRMAHQLLKQGIREIPRIITEHAHSKTGIDIHPGASIGRHFCIDHGTGVVIGETTVIGNYVKIYQGVTLGALSVNKEDASRKRHPTLEDNVIVYAGATILGGDTTIGHDSIIGGNVWLTRTVPPFSKIYYQARMFNGDTNETDLVVFKSHE
ncbi:MAG TPA: serine acetyltransferase [Ohtaekwangia sp.]|uniref:serine O-acetyltransferase n=1 Tax=Ohtaekwangia sp. TaxID=2066019 RepID=UPI002F937722